VLARVIDHTVFATDKENPYGALAGVSWEWNNDRPIAVATDGHQLVIQEWQIKSSIGTPTWGCRKKDENNDSDVFPIVSVPFLTLLAKVLKDKNRTSESKIAFLGTFQKTHVKIECGDITLLSRLIDGRFPAWKTVIPQSKHVPCAIVESGKLLDAIKKAGIVSTSLYRGIIMSFERGRLILSGRGEGIGKTRLTMSLSYDGDNRILKLDQKMLASVLQVLSGDVSIYIPEDGKAAKFTVDGLSYVLMPMKILKEEIDESEWERLEAEKKRVSVEADVESDTTEPEADTGIEVVGQYSTMEKPMREIDESPYSDDDTDLQTRFFQLQMEQDQLQAKVAHYKTLLDRAIRIIERMKNDQRVCV